MRGPVLMELRTRLELQAERELNVALASRLRGGDLPEVGVLLVGVRSEELRSIRDVCPFRAELQGDALGKGEVLEHGEIQRTGRWTDVALQSHIALGQPLLRSQVSERDEVRDVEILVRLRSPQGTHSIVR